MTCPVSVSPMPVGRAGDPEVGDLDPPVRRHQQVGGLDVAVHDAGRVRRAAGVGGLGEQVAGRVGVQRLSGQQQRGQRLAVDELHHQERPVHAGPVGGGRLAEVEDGRDARVVQGRGVAGLGLEARPERRVVGVLRLEQLHRDAAAEHGVGRPPDLAHPAGGDPRVQTVAAGLVGEAGLRVLVGHCSTASMTALAIGPPS